MAWETDRWSATNIILEETVSGLRLALATTGGGSRCRISTSVTLVIDQQSEKKRNAYNAYVVIVVIVVFVVVAVFVVDILGSRCSR